MRRELCILLLHSFPIQRADLVSADMRLLTFLFYTTNHD